MAYTPMYPYNEDTGIGSPSDIGKPINIDPLSSLGEPRRRPSSKSKIKKSEMYAKALGDEAMRTDPAGHWAAALARPIQGIAAGWEEAQANKMDDERREYMAAALEGTTDPAELMRQGIAEDMPELTEFGQYREGEADEDRRFEYTQGRDVAADAWREREFAADEAYRNRPEKPQRYRISENLVDESGNIIYEGTPKPPKPPTAEQVKGTSIMTGAQHHADVLFEGGTAIDPVPKLDELASFWNTTGRMAEGYGGSAVMSEDAQKTLDALRGLTQQYIYALSGQQAPESEVQRVLAGVIPSTLDQPGRITEKKKEIANMWATIKSRAASSQPAADTGGGDPYEEARQAIENGADPELVRRRLEENGIDPTGLD